jgi:ABC-2 type transport system permease protein
VLWYKAWLETRSRFLASLATLTLFSSIFFHHALYISCSSTFPCPEVTGHPGWSEFQFQFLLFVNQQYIVIMWILAVVLLGMGGLLREKALGTSSLTLTLPVSRARLMGVRVAMGILQSIALGVVPWLAVLLISFRAGMSVSFAQVGIYILLLVAGGLIYFAMAVLFSSLVSGEYTAPALTFGAILLGGMLFDNWLRRFNVWRLVTGDFSIDKGTFLLSKHVPWPGLLASLCAAALLLLASLIAVQRKEF